MEDMISDTIITRGCGNRTEVTSFVLFKGGRKRGALLPTPPSKTLRVLVPPVCLIRTPCLYRSERAAQGAAAADKST